MSLAEVTSTSTREPRPRAVWKNLHRTAPPTSTTSPTCQPRALRRTRAAQAQAAGEKPSDDVIDRLILPLVDAAVPDWQTTLDAMLALPEIGTRVGFSGGVIAVGVRLAATDPRIAAAGLFAGSYVPRSAVEEARGIGIPIHVLLQWDDEGNDRQAALDLFDAFGSREKTLVANMGGHTGVPVFAGEDAGRFFVRHLRDDDPSRVRACTTRADNQTGPKSTTPTRRCVGPEVCILQES